MAEAATGPGACVFAPQRVVTVLGWPLGAAVAASPRQIRRIFQRRGEAPPRPAGAAEVGVRIRSFPERQGGRAEGGLDGGVEPGDPL
jgi:hypothetical protein